MKNKKIWLFLFRFLGTYSVLFLIYFVFLTITQKTNESFKCDPLTTNVAEQSTSILNKLDQNIQIEQDLYELSVNLLIDGEYVVGIIEGCNSMSIIILFIAFVIAFKGTLKNTLWFSLVGALSIYYVNILRIVILTYGMHHYPTYTWLFHDLVFPAIIYGYIFLLWIFWVNYLSDFKKIKNE